MRKTSAIWTYFEEYSEEHGKCSICGVIISTRGTGGSTSNLRRHLTAKHRKIVLDPSQQTVFKPKYQKDDSTDNENENVVEEEIIVENCTGDTFHSEVVFHDYTSAVEPPELIIEENKKQTLTPGRRMKETKRKIIQEVISPIKSTKKLKSHSYEVTKKPTKPREINETCMKQKTIEQIAYNLDRIATAFEKIANVLCSEKEKVEESRKNVNSNNLNEMIMEVLGVDEEHATDVADTKDTCNCDVEEELQTEKNPLFLLGLNLLPKLTVKEQD